LRAWVYEREIRFSFSWKVAGGIEQWPASTVIVEERMPLNFDKIRASVLVTGIATTQPAPMPRPEFLIEIDVPVVVSREK